MEDKQRLYVRTLLWASDRGTDGFTLAELKEAVTDDEGEAVWVERFLLGEIGNEPPFIFHLGEHRAGAPDYKYFLTGSGASAVTHYRELQEARKSGKDAMTVAIWSIGIAIVVGILQVALSWYQIFILS